MNNWKDNEVSKHFDRFYKEKRGFQMRVVLLGKMRFQNMLTDFRKEKEVSKWKMRFQNMSTDFRKKKELSKLEDNFIRGCINLT